MTERFHVEEWLHEHYNKTLKEALDEMVNKLGAVERAMVVVRILRMLGVTPEDIVKAKLCYNFT